MSEERREELRKEGVVRVMTAFSIFLEDWLIGVDEGDERLALSGLSTLDTIREASFELVRLLIPDLTEEQVADEKDRLSREAKEYGEALERAIGDGQFDELIDDYEDKVRNAPNN